MSFIVRPILKKITYFLLAVAAILFAAYYFQPIKKGKGVDTITQYELVKDWPRLPEGFKLGNPTGIGIDTSQNMVVFHRAYRKWPLLGSMPNSLITENTILILDKQTGKIINSWGKDLFIMPHGLTVDKKNNIWVTDVGLHQVFKFTHDGELLMRLGEAKVHGDDTGHFNKPTDLAIMDDGSFYVSDGYGNSRIIKFSSTGQYLFEWGTKGSKQGGFDIPHGIATDDSGNVYVADRENNRVQVFSSSGKFLKQFHDKSFGNIYAVTFDKTRKKLFTIDDFTFLKIKHRGSDIYIFDKTGIVQTRFGRSGSYNGQPGWYHDITVDNEENIYVGDIRNNKVLKFRKIISP